MGKTLMIGSCEPFSGKSALVLGISKYLIEFGKSIRFGKPLATSFEIDTKFDLGSQPLVDDDVRFVGAILGLPQEQLIPSAHLLSPDTAEKRLLDSQLLPGEDFRFIQEIINADFDGLNILEGAGSLHEGLLYGLSLVQVSKALKAKVLIVHLWRDSTSIDALLAARAQLGENLAGVVLNAVTPDDLQLLKDKVVPALTSLGFEVYGVMPRSPLLRSVTVEELVRRLQARVICCEEKLELMVETLTIGAMNVNSAMEVFRKRRNMAVVTGADRTDIQLAALEASTQCLILTGASEPLPQLQECCCQNKPVISLNRALFSIDSERLHEDIKAAYAFRLVNEHCDIKRFLENIGIDF